jgi:hypothetical protein
MDVMLRDKAEELAKQIAVQISTQQELTEVMRAMSKSVIERILDAEMDVHLGRGRGAANPLATAVSPEAPIRGAEKPVPATPSEPRQKGKRKGGNRRIGADDDHDPS